MLKVCLNVVLTFLFCCRHILRNDYEANEMPCGMCGLVGRQQCTLDVTISAAVKDKKGEGGGEPRMSVAMAGACIGYPRMLREGITKMKWKAAGKQSGIAPCTNIPVPCQVCSNSSGDAVYVWKYNMPAHYATSHPDLNIPDDVRVKEDEARAVLAKTFTKKKTN